MSTNATTDELHALIDGELGPEEAERVLQDLRDDPLLQAELAELQKLKYLVRHAYADAGVSMPPPQPRALWRRVPAVAAIVMVCLTAGWVARDLWIAQPGQRIAASEAIDQGLVATADEPVLIHLDKPDPASWQGALDTVERLLREDPSHSARVELLVNAGGIPLLKAGGTPYTDRIQELARRNPNLALFACARGMQLLRDKGMDVQLLDDAHTAPSALEHVVDRLTKGWRYVGI